MKKFLKDFGYLIGIFLIVVVMILLHTPEPRVQQMTEFEVKNLVWSITSKYDSGIPDIYFDQGMLEFKTDSLGETVCNKNTKSCYVVFQPCSLYDNNIDELAAHEATHVVVANLYNKYDHGREWRRIMYDLGYPIAKPEIHTKTCNMR